MAIYVTDSKTIDELQETGKLTGSERTIISNGTESRKVSIDTIVGYAVNAISKALSVPISGANITGGNNIVFVPEGEDVPILERSPGTFYLEEVKQTSIRTTISLPTSVQVSRNLGLKRV